MRSGGGEGEWASSNAWLGMGAVAVDGLACCGRLEVNGAVNALPLVAATPS